MVYENQEQFREFIKESVNNKQFDKKMYFGSVSPELASLIKEKTGVEVEGYNCSLSSYEIRKILKDHGNEETKRPRGQRAITEDEIINIPKVIEAPDNVKKGERDYDGKPVILFDKIFEGKMTVVAVVSEKHLDLRVQTVYAGAKKGNLATPVDAKSPTSTSETSKYEFVLRSNTKDDAEYQEKAEDLYYDNEGEKEAYETMNRMDLVDLELRKQPRNQPDLTQPKLNFVDIKNSLLTI